MGVKLDAGRETTMNQPTTTMFYVLILSTHWAWGLQCYDCFDIGPQFPDPGCVDPSQGVNVQQNATNEKTTEVRTSQKGPGNTRQGLRPICVAYFGVFRETPGVVRTHSEKPTTVSNGCIVVEESVPKVGSFIGHACVCDTDLCNGSNDYDSYSYSSLNSSVGLLSLGLLSTLLTPGTALVVLA